MNLTCVFSSYLFMLCACLQAFTNAQDPMPDNERFLFSPFAISGMIKGLLDMQIRPQGGYYEEKYKKIFKDNESEQSIESLFVDRFDTDLHEPGYTSDELLYQDAKLLRESMKGRGPNPCFEIDRIERNPLLGLMCSLQLQKEMNTKPEIAP
ncbi:uncharacterized protein [Parasteatoda tepidariorum]|uniref:uncharacterized protein n=1 Tax=Parasteatoda tepidariorum TaxID=114398 RepID=UPI00077FBC0A|nr:uncharacterized protein LOC107453251 [Parasteatoda tepidariorum]